MSQAKKTYEDLVQDVLKEVRTQAGELVCKQVIRCLRRMPTTVPEDNELGLDTFWDSICYQMQVEQSFAFDIYMIDVDKQVEYFTRQLPEHQIAALWLSTDDALESFADYDAGVDRFIEAVVLVIRDEYLLETAKNSTNKKIYRAINAIDKRFYANYHGKFNK